MNPNPQYTLVPVGADWTGNDNIVGYPNGLDENTYVTKPALELIRHALDPANALVPHFLILDEMNLHMWSGISQISFRRLNPAKKYPLYEGNEQQANNKPCHADCDCLTISSSSAR